VEQGTGIKTSFFGKTHNTETKTKIALTKFIALLRKADHLVAEPKEKKQEVTNIQTNDVMIFKNNLEAAKNLNIGESTLRRYKKDKKILLEKYIITNI